MLRDTLNSDLKKAMLAGDTQRLGVLRMVVAAIQNKIIEKRARPGSRNSVVPPSGTRNTTAEFSLPDKGLAELLTDEEVTEVLQKELKKRKEAAELYYQGNRQELAAQEEREAAVIQTYLPAALSESEIRSVVKKILAEKKPVNFGEAMKYVVPALKGRADSKLVAEIVKQAIS